jgi:microcystin-dependent protein
MSEIKVNKISPRSGTDVTLGDSGDTFTIPAGATLAISGTVTGITSILTGSIIMYGSGSIPTGYLECTGQAVSRSTYADLFTVIGTTFGVGDGTTTFNVPDLRDNFPVGKSGTKALATKAGSNTATLATTNLASHRHSALGSNYTAAQVDTAAFQPRQNAYNFDISTNIGNTGSGTAFNTFPPYIALTFIIKT